MDQRPFVLIVEDEPANRALASRILTARDYPHEMAVDGLDALNKIASRRPDLILMDLSMPVLDGWETTRRIRTEPSCQQIRILALTAHAMVGDRDRAIAAGCNDVLTKPYRPAQLISAIEAVMAGDLAATETQP